MPAWTQERAFVNQRVQIGVEAAGAHGTPVAANKSLQAFSWEFEPATDLQVFGATGRKYDQAQIENMEWMKGVWTGPLDFNHVIYMLGSAFGSVNPAAHGVSTVAKDWVYVPPVTGSLEPNTFTIQQGDPNTRAHQLYYGLVDKFGYKLDRKTTTNEGTLFAQQLADAITMTASPTAIALAPVASKMWNVYLDSTSGALGTTQLLRAVSISFEIADLYSPFWVLNRANLSFPAHVDKKPKPQIKLKVEADSQGMGLLALLQAGSTQFVRVQAQGAVIDNLQTVTLGTQSSGTFTLTYKSQTTSAIAYNATSAAVQTALLALSSFPAGTVTVTGSAGGPYAIVIGGSLSQDTTAITGNFASLTTPGNASIAQNQSYNGFTHDLAVKIGKPSKFEDADGLFAIEWELILIEDLTWGNAHKFTVTNLMTAL